MVRYNSPHSFILVATVALSACGACGSALEAEKPATKAQAPAAVTPEPQSAPSSPSAPTLKPGMLSVADVAERAVPSVVNISVTKQVEVPSSPFGFGPQMHPFFRGRPDSPRKRQQEGSGSGVIVRADGIVLTNNHVVEDADRVLVTLHDERELEAEVLGTDPPSDLAVLKLKDSPENLPTLPLGDSEALRLGEVVVAIGNPFGVGQTVTMGIVSAKGRANVGIVDYEDFIQTDAAINPGNSGGALVNLSGELVGINTAILSRTGGYQGIGFAIPSNMARGIMTSLIEEGRVVRGFLGVMIQDLSPELAEAMDVEVTDGAVVAEVMPGSPAEDAGLEAGDVIIELDGVPLESSAKLRNLVAQRGAGRTVALTVVRDGETRQLEVTLGKKDGGTTSSARPAEGQGVLQGLELRALDPEVRNRMKIPDRVGEGVVVTGVRRGSPAARAGLRPGDIILSANGERVSTPADVRNAAQKKSGQVLLRVFGRGGARFVVLRGP